MNQQASQAQEALPPPQRKKKVDNRRAFWRWVKRGAIAFVGLLVAGLMIYGWLPKPLDVEAGAVSKGPMRVTIDEDGVTRVKERHMVRAPITGELARIALVAGDLVEQDAVIAKIFPSKSPLLDPRSRATAEARMAAASAAERQSQARIAHAKAAYDFAREDTKRLEALSKSGAAAKRELDSAKLNERTSEAELRAAELGARVAVAEVAAQRAMLDTGEKGDLSAVEVRAPVRGRVLRVLEQSAGLVAAGTPLLELGDVSAIEVVVDVLSRDAVEIKPGAEALLERWGGKTIEGKVERVEPSAFTRLSALGVEEQRVNVIVHVPKPPAALGDGFRVEVKIVVWQDDAVLRAPASALFRDGDGWALFEIADGKAHKRLVTLGRRTGTEAQIVDGLTDGARVIVHPSDRIQDGSEVITP
ncbi:MAG TPA: efflux RND transporter periplasmic adaptor subunit [Polyangiaceae bacterium]|jgi:HlyD family secretion protein|nr:efflux RND transporter periplasmic adaptor subunit [Polyangiaceae bacterium]